MYSQTLLLRNIMNANWLTIYINILVVVCAMKNKPRILNDNEIVVNTSHGLVKGKLMKTFSKGVEYFGFFKIPYATPPVGNRRFQAPEPSNHWTGVYDATREGAECVQCGPNNTVVGSEDCLFLRVYTPKSRSKVNELLPIMYFIHGGGFTSGSPNCDEYGPDIFMEMGVVLAFVQYRLGIFGFVSTEDMNCPGNNGLKDQRLGLRWIKENAKVFGGDPDKITIFGHSAGSISVGLLVNSPTTAGLFRAAIQQSSAEIAPLIQFKAKEMACSVGKQFGVSTNNSVILLDELRKIDYKKLQDTATKVGKQFNPKIIPYFPVIEPDHPEAILKQKPLQQLQSGNYNRVPIIIGFTSLEGVTLMDQVEVIKTKMKSDITVLVPDTLFPSSSTAKFAVAKEIKDYYFGGTNGDYGILRYVSDNFIVRCVLKKSYTISSRSYTYLYKFSYKGVLGDPLNPNRLGIGHSEELSYIFHKSNEPKVVSENDTRIRYQLVTIWTDFAKTLNPTPNKQPLLDNVKWPLLNQKTNYRSLSINNKLTIQERVNETDLRFWEKMFTYDTAHIGWY